MSDIFCPGCETARTMGSRRRSITGNPDGIDEFRIDEFRDTYPHHLADGHAFEVSELKGDCDPPCYHWRSR
jgi:hypothetical protein